MTRRRKLHRLSAGRGTKIENCPRLGRDQPGGEGGGKILYPPSAFAKARDAGNRRAVHPHVARRQRQAIELLRIRITRKAQVQRRAVRNLAPRRRDDVIAPG